MKRLHINDINYQALVKKLNLAEDHFDKYLLRRTDRLVPVKRYVIGWLLIMLLLIGGVIGQSIMLSGYYQTLRPIPGGIYNEGVLGTFGNANPIYATSDIDTTISHLIFAGLFTYNKSNHLVGDLASSYSVDKKGTTYTVHLKPHLTWQDGKSLTSRDVVFTYHLIQSPDVQSPLASSWQGVKVSAPNRLTVTFKLPNVLASFPYSLTNGIVPEHLLASIPIANLRSSNFNTLHPVGSGPFSWSGIQIGNTNSQKQSNEQIALTPFAHYQGGKPKLSEFIVHAYASKTALVSSFESGQLNGLIGLNHVPKAIRSMSTVRIHNFILTAGTYVFFKTTSGVLSDQSVRQALVMGANVPSILRHLGFTTRPVNEPLLVGQLGYNPSYAQAGFNLIAAKQLLTKDGWIIGKNDLRYKNNVPLSFILTASNNRQNAMVTRMLTQQWRNLGVQLQVQLLPLNNFTTILSSHSYQAVLDGISIGVDPDVFVYWDSSQADPRSTSRLNLSEFKNHTADIALESGRTRLNKALRIIKYQPFLQVWQQQAPALGLYQPRVLYITNGKIYGLHSHIINVPTDRFNNIQNWQIRSAMVTNSSKA